jgi:hypothetical protein
VTAAPTIRRFEESVTVPAIDPVIVCANADLLSTIARAKIISVPISNLEQRRLEVNMEASFKAVLKLSGFS